MVQDKSRQWTHLLLILCKGFVSFEELLLCLRVGQLEHGNAVDTAGHCGIFLSGYSCEEGQEGEGED
jgi:hypothetical protein